MQAKICPVCSYKFYSKSKGFERNSVIHSNCGLRKKPKQRKELRPVRTSTPVAEIEKSPSECFSDSVTDFFYQSWKNGLHSNDLNTYQRSFCQWNQQPQTAFQPVCYAPQVIYVSTFQFFTIQPLVQVQQLGFRSDGTYGVLPVYWPFHRC